MTLRCTMYKKQAIIAFIVHRRTVGGVRSVAVVGGRKRLGKKHHNNNTHVQFTPT